MESSQRAEYTICKNYLLLSCLNAEIYISNELKFKEETLNLQPSL